ncbi:MAG TPA: alpha/beta hydrolase, partial [Myxococcaceae bacterium]
LREFGRTLGELPEPVPLEVARDFQVSTIHRAIPASLLATFVGESMKVPAHVWQRAMEGVLAFRSVSFLARLNMPTLIVWGDHDAIVSRSEQELLRQGIEAAILSVLEDTGHAVHWERSESFVEQLLAFIRPEARAARGGTRAPR